MESRRLRAGLRVWVALGRAFLCIPIVLVVLYAFSASNIESWPISGFTLHWFSVAWHDAQVRSAFLLSLRVGLVATALALVLGSAVAYALSKFAFFGREAISFLLVLPLALPGIITGIALNSFFSFTGIQLGTLTIVLAIVPVVLAARLAGAGSVTRSAVYEPAGELGGFLVPDLALDAGQHGRHAAQP